MAHPPFTQSSEPSVSAGLTPPDTRASAVRLQHLTLRDFRNIARADLAVPEAGFVLVGRNGQGKTNLLEAVHYLHAVRSMRGAPDQDLIRFGAHTLHIGARATGARVDEARIGVERGARRRRLVLDGVEVRRQSEALGAVPSVVLSPRDVALVSGAPQERRRFLDILLAATSPRYLLALQRYRAALVRRNAVLKEAGNRADGTALISAWEPALADSGATLWSARAAWAARAGPRLRELCAHIGEPGAVALRYLTSARERVAGEEPELQQFLRELLARDRSTDLRHGLTRHGPHRDDLTFGLDNRSARAFASAGQQRTIALALRLVEAETLRERVERDPILLLDDPFAELDRDRARGMLECLRILGTGQRLLVVPRADDVPAGFGELARWTIEDGVVTHE
jgi:DNA replication and repair protein RecF